MRPRLKPAAYVGVAGPTMATHDMPFCKSPMHPWVHVAHGSGPYANTHRALQQVDLSGVRGKRVLVKPNVGRVAGPESGIVTHPQVVAAAIDAFRDAGADVAVGESPIVGVNLAQAFAAAGIEAVALERGCPLIDMDRRPFAEVSVPEGQAIHSLKVCPEALEYDVLVSVPVMKMHMHTVVTLAVKNMKGCLWRRSKVELHMLPQVEGREEKPLDVAIADLSSVLRPHLAIIDGTVGMEGLGPSAGRPRPLDAVVVSADAFAADAVACELMGVDARRVPHLRLGAARGYGVIALDRLAVTPDGWRRFAQAFARPPENLAIEFPKISVLDKSSCSACQSTLLLFLIHHKERIFDYFPSQEKIHVAIGKGHTQVPDRTLLVGNCTAPHRDHGVFVPGCPPVGSQILNAIAQKPSAADGRADAPPPDDNPSH